MNSRAFQFQLQAAEAAATAAPVHAAYEDETEPPIPMPLQLELVAQAAPPAPGQGSGVAPAGVGKPEIIKCPECPKWFTSEKAMFGHLRKHPERGYKGATRPATASAVAAAVAGDKKWRKQVVWKEADVSSMNMTAAAAAATDEDEEAAMILLEMASSSRSTTSETQQESVQQPVSAVHHKTQDVVQPMLVDHVAGHQQITPLAEQIVQPEIVLELSAESQTTPAPVKELTNLEITTKAVLIVVPANKKPIIAPSPGTKKQTKKRPAQLDLERIAAASPAPPEGADGKLPAARRIPSPASNKKHVCPTCGKSFPSYQALGGHMSSHVKGKTTGARHDELAVAQAAVHNILAHRCQSAGSSVATAAASTGSGAAGWVQDLNLQLQDVVVPPTPTVAVAQTAAAPASPHVCTECQMIFPSGQALGGHRRKHWFPEKHQAKAAAAAELLAAAPAPAEAAPAEIAASASVARHFDLNELPEEGEGESNQP